MEPNPTPADLVAQIDSLVDKLTQNILEDGGNPGCHRPAPRSAGERTRLCAREWGHTDGEHAYMRPNALDKLSEYAPLCCEPEAGSLRRCMRPWRHDGGHDFADFAELDREADSDPYWSTR